jgi:hypothetical protein
VLLLLGLGWGAWPGRLCAQSAEEYEVKAAFLYNFGKFVTWPSTRPDSGPVVACVLGKDPFGPVLDQTLMGKNVQNRPIIARRIKDIEALGQCDIAFIAASEQRRVPAVLALAEKSGVLLAGDFAGFAESGGAIGFVMEGNKVRFKVNPEAAARAGIQISSQLLQLATIVSKK